MTEVCLMPLSRNEREWFVAECQQVFRHSSLEEFGVRNTQFEEDGEIVSRKSIEGVLDAPGAETFLVVAGGVKAGGVTITVDDEHDSGCLELLFISSRSHGRGIGQAAWSAVEKMHPEVAVWGTVTPRFETRNIHFYVNRCGFNIVEYYNRQNPYPAATKQESKAYDDYFRFEKRIK